MTFLKSFLKAALLLISLSNACAASSYEDHLLAFSDTGIVAANTSHSIHWLTDTSFAVNTYVKGRTSVDSDLLVYDLTARTTTLVRERARLHCWISEKQFGVARIKTQASGEFRKARLNTQGQLEITETSASPDDCLSEVTRQLHYKSQYRALDDLGPGIGAVWIPDPNNVEDFVFIKESGERIPFHLQGKTQRGGYPYYPWLGAYGIGDVQGIPFQMTRDGVIYPVPEMRRAANFFRGPSLYTTKIGYFVSTGVKDPFNGDTYFVPFGKSPVRVYKSKGGWDQIGPNSVSPSGCIALRSLSANGPINRFLALANEAPQTLHFVDVCKEFSQK